MLKLIAFLFDFGDRVARHHLSAYAAQAAFFTVLSFFPFLISMMSLIQFVPITDSEIEGMIISFIPEAIYGYVEPLIIDTFNNSTGALLSLSIIVTLWSASKGVMSIKNGFNTITSFRKSNNYFIVRITCTLYTLLFSFAMVLLIVLLVFGNQIFQQLLKHIEFLDDMAKTFGTLRMIVSICLLLLFFMIFYRFVPDKKDTLLHSLPGAILSTIGWIAISLGFSIYIDNFNNFAIMYGSIAGIMLTLLWLYFCMFILFIGSELNNYIFGEPEQDKSYLPI